MSASIIPFPGAAWRDTLAELADAVDYMTTAEYLFCATVAERRRLTERQLDDLNLLLWRVRQRAERSRAADAGGAA